MQQHLKKRFNLPDLWKLGVFPLSLAAGLWPTGKGDMLLRRDSLTLSSYENTESEWTDDAVVGDFWWNFIPVCARRVSDSSWL